MERHRRPAPPVDPARPGAELLRWPEDAERREELRRARHPRLLLLAPHTPPPDPTDDGEDWAWLPIDERDLFARLRRLSAAAPPSDQPDLAAVHVDPDDVLDVAGRVLPLPRIEAAPLRVLLDPPTRIHERDELARAIWGDADRRRRSLDSRVLTLRRRIAPLGLAIHVVRGRGFVLGTRPPGETT